MTLSIRKSLTALAVAATVAGAAPAHAQLVQYYTTGVFSTSGTSTATFGTGANTLTLAYRSPFGATNPLLPSTAANPAEVFATSFGSLGFFDASGGGSTLVPVSGTFTLNIFQMAPGMGSGSLIGSLSGELRVNQSQAIFDATGAGSVTINGIQYRFRNESYAIVPPTTNAGVTSLQGVITGTAVVPEPATFALVGTGLVLAGLGARRTRKTAV